MCVLLSIFQILTLSVILLWMYHLTIRQAANDKNDHPSGLYCGMIVPALVSREKGSLFEEITIVSA